MVKGGLGARFIAIKTQTECNIIKTNEGTNTWTETNYRLLVCVIIRTLCGHITASWWWIIIRTLCGHIAASWLCVIRTLCGHITASWLVLSGHCVDTLQPPGCVIRTLYGHITASWLCYPDTVWTCYSLLVVLSGHCVDTLQPPGCVLSYGHCVDTYYKAWNQIGLFRWVSQVHKIYYLYEDLRF